MKKKLARACAKAPASFFACPTVSLRVDMRFPVLSLKGKNQRNFKKTTIAKRQKVPKKRKVHKNERAHFCEPSSF